LLSRQAKAFTRYIGQPTDPNMRAVSDYCHGWNQTNFKAGLCPALLRCVLDNVASDISAGMQSGGNIASLVPTITALLGAPPLDLVQMAIVSPHRALATCCFSIGLPSGLFRQLKPLLPRLGDRIEHEAKLREWVFQLPTSSSDKWQYGWRNTLIRSFVDAIILLLAALMLWYSWTVNIKIMITWRCEYGLLLFLWPMSCIAWLLVAMLLLHLMKQDMQILYFDTSPTNPKALNVLQLMVLPYRLPRPSALPRAEAQRLPKQGSSEESKAVTDTNQPSSERTTVTSAARNEQTTKATTTFSGYTSPTVVIRIRMPHDFGIRSWRWYEAILEALAVGIYLYATFVLTSVLFMSGEMALDFACVVTLCLSGVRILGTLF